MLFFFLGTSQVLIWKEKGIAMIYDMIVYCLIHIIIIFYFHISFIEYQYRLEKWTMTCGFLALVIDNFFRMDLWG
jgi:amino acid transporter